MINPGFLQASLCKVQGLQGLLKDFPTVFKAWKLMKNTGKNSTSEMLESITDDISFKKSV